MSKISIFLENRQILKKGPLDPYESSLGLS